MHGESIKNKQRDHLCNIQQYVHISCFEKEDMRWVLVNTCMYITFKNQ